MDSMAGKKPAVVWALNISVVVLVALCAKRKRALTAWIKGHGAVEGTKTVYTRKVPTEKFTAGFEDKAKPTKPVETGDDSLDSHFD